MAIVYIGIGSNLTDPAKQIKLAVSALNEIIETKVLAISSLYGSKPMGPQDQPDYMNAVAKLETSLLPLELLDCLQKIELNSGRVRKDQRWGARILDLDILLFDDLIINNERLTVPHYGMKVREFVLYPLAELSPQLVMPDGTSVMKLKNNIPQNDLMIIGQLN